MADDRRALTTEEQALSREFEAILPAFEALLPLPRERRDRALRWVAAKFEIDLDGA